MRQFTYLLGILFLPLTLSAQHFQQLYGSNNADSMNGMVQCDDGSMLIVGHSDGFEGGQDDLLLFKTDHYGNPLEVKVWGGEGTDTLDEINPGPEDTYYFTGTSSSFSADGDFDTFYGQMDANANILWTKRLNHNGMEQARKIIMSSDGGFLLTGIANSFSENGDVDFFVLKGSSEGETEWFTVLGSSEYEVSVSCAEAPDQSGFFIWGHCNGELTDQYDAMLTKLGNEGELLWTKTYAASANELAWDILVLEDGGVLLCGDTGSAGAGLTDIYLLEIDSEGSPIWSSTYGAYSNDHGTSIVEMENEMLAIVGLSSSFGSGGLDMMMLTLDQMGNMKVNGAYGGDNKEVSFDSIYTQDQGVAMCGYTRSFGEGFNTGMVCKLDIDAQMGCNQHFSNSFERHDFDLLVANFQLQEVANEISAVAIELPELNSSLALSEKICSDETPSVEGLTAELNSFTDVAQNNPITLPNLQQDRVGNILIFPNPASEMVKVQWPAIAAEVLTISLVGMDGKTVKSQEYQFEESGLFVPEISLLDVDAGVYILELSSHELQLSKQVLVQ
jgi:hypothetical protein